MLLTPTRRDHRDLRFSSFMGWQFQCLSQWYYASAKWLQENHMTLQWSHETQKSCNHPLNFIYFWALSRIQNLVILCLEGNVNRFYLQLFGERIKQGRDTAFPYGSGLGSTSHICHGWWSGAKIRLELVLITTPQEQYLKSLLVVECPYLARVFE